MFTARSFNPHSARPGTARHRGPTGLSPSEQPNRADRIACGKLLTCKKAYVNYRRSEHPDDFDDLMCTRCGESKNLQASAGTDNCTYVVCMSCNKPTMPPTGDITQHCPKAERKRPFAIYKEPYRMFRTWRIGESSVDNPATVNKSGDNGGSTDDDDNSHAFLRPHRLRASSPPATPAQSRTVSTASSSTTASTPDTAVAGHAIARLPKRAKAAGIDTISVELELISAKFKSIRRIGMKNGMLAWENIHPAVADYFAHGSYAMETFDRTIDKTFADGASGKNAAAVEAFPRPRDSYGGSILPNSAPHPNLPRRLPDPKELPWIAAYPPDTVDANDYWKISPPPSLNPSYAEPFDPSTLQFSLKDFKFAEPVHDDPDTLIHFPMRCLWLEEDMRRERRRHRQPIVVKYRFQLGLAASVPRPKLPVNQAFRNWIGLLAPAKETTYGQSYMPTNYMPEQDFDTEEDFLAAMDDFIIAAQQWMLLRQDKALPVKLAIIADSSDQPGRPQDVLAGIAPIVVDPAVYAADPTAPPFFRHHRWWTFTHFPLPHNPVLLCTTKPCRAVILSNVNYIPRPPLTGYCRTCIDGRHRLQEESRYPQWHAQGRWHMPFIPTDNYGGIQYHVNHSTKYPGLMEYYAVKLPHGFVTSDNIHFSPGCELRIAMAAHWDAATGRLTTLPRAYAMQRPMHAQEVGHSALVHLFNQELPECLVKETMASWQRSVAELDGYWVYCQCRIELQKESDKYNGKLQMAVDCRLGFPTRLPARSVYTMDPRVAALYAQFGVPVWLVMMPPFHCETPYYSDADVPRQLAHLARAQEYQTTVPVNEEALEDYDDPRDDPRNYNDPHNCQNDDVVMQDDGPSYDNDVHMHESAPLAAVAVPEQPLLEGKMKRKGLSSKAKKNKASALGVPSYLPRVKKLREDPTHPIQNSRFMGGHYASPPIDPFTVEMHKDSVPSTTSSIFARYAQLHATLLAMLASTPLVDLNTFRPKTWKEILNGQLKEQNQALVARHLGFDLDAPPDIIEDDRSGHEHAASDLAVVLDSLPSAPAPFTSTAQGLPVALGGPLLRPCPTGTGVRYY
ncbi:hypothetical protein AURDEDRAFT_163579 [Auricularia subglabra TFB-10046 SS5]|nr:hypothetical protein AURDEDRAFT_163579 [Auricularia subglabra TFB-10046 SS5]